MAGRKAFARRDGSAGDSTVVKVDELAKEVVGLVARRRVQVMPVEVGVTLTRVDSVGQSAEGHDE